ncbi:PTS mannitol transporter subunit IICBA [Bacillus sp. AFS088145]|uniref:PTS mannitol transporter subunit IICB n=1 Tax=Bacillus sp. AFS088145 TaxID=2033514 RepID=UPI000BF39627|nr:PTS mannitol transporter subunit IICBA [Bacillus sp. AFS088145]PFH85647.1 PTS mannitol transporter subunit IIBC [Bacillus sp. AFS088145]
MLNTVKNSNIKVKIQRFGSFLSGMVMPNIGAFIAWGLITALFIPTGWIPNAKLAVLVSPMITYLLPLLIGFTGGRMVHDIRGGVVGAIATMGVIVGAEMPMFLGAMIMGPLGGLAIKKFDQAIQGKVKSGFEMLVNNFSAGILGAILAIIALIGVNPVVSTLTEALANGVDMMVRANVIPLANIFIEPAKILFLNNAINHGILSPIGLEQAKSAGKSLLFLLEANPGPGLGVLLAYTIFGKGTAKQTAPGAVIIHFLGGIHEIYFPYILMRPLLIFSVIAGGVAGTFTFNILGAGLVAAASPGSIIAILAMAPKGGYLPILAGVFVATAVSFIVSAVVLKSSKSVSSDEDLERAAQKTQDLKGTSLLQTEKEVASSLGIDKEVKKIIFACDAGMGSSAMGASILRKKVKTAGIELEVTNVAINNLPNDVDVVITHKDLTDRAKAKVPNAVHISVENFLNSPKYDELVNSLVK